MKKFFIALIGGTVLLLGVAMVVLPGPGLPIVAAGLGILATEFIWARRTLRRAKGAASKIRRKSGFRAWLQRRTFSGKRQTGDRSVEKMERLAMPSVPPPDTIISTKTN